jgi:hypothetical protein
MARHYYRTNVPLPVMVLWWVFCGICVLIYGCYDYVFQKPQRDVTAQAQVQWERRHLNGWRLEQSYDAEHGLFRDRMNNGETCTTKAYPGYPTCPPQQYFIDGNPQAPPQTQPAVKP